MRVRGIHERHQHEHHRGEGDQDVPGEATLGGLGLHVLRQANALADHVADVLQHLAQIAAGLTLDQRRGDEEGEVGALDAHGHVLERLFERLAEAVLLVAATELALERIGQLLAHHLHAGRKAVPGLEHAREKVQRFGELQGDGSLPAVTLVGEHEEREPASQHKRNAGDDQVVGQDRREHEHAERAAAGDAQEHRDGGVGIGLHDHAVQPVQWPPADHVVGGADGFLIACDGEGELAPAAPAALFGFGRQTLLELALFAAEQSVGGHRHGEDQQRHRAGDQDGE